ncbi:Gfo/Idh/MocA family oxidoreductase [Coraliomargarita algicola]|uniref:Gfo/Idh/MocA family oxidoreductase n=1 Tax=Coraliomargarita algicola TaxID=3092156 RepID=A0ABZ0RM33_9BACT|nr:Gfo/Idh/MocA family oxidoreductase [Coraliomargarita sp. J2-16]WPJ96216.1 Gfo/Idh/MocA family oxidoreductase [Coraliomargarita sp. J2-16]
MAPATKRKYGVALVGLGRYATGQLMPALQHTQNCQLVALVTGTKSKAALYGGRYQIPDTHIYNYDNFDRIVENEDVDIVYIVLPNSMHAEYSIRAANAGKHVICEKPMALSVAESQAMIAAGEANQVTLNIGYRLHFHQAHRVAIQVGREQPEGAVKYMQAELAFKVTDPSEWRLNKALAGGGALYDLGIYCIQAARYSTGQSPVSVIAREYKTDAELFSQVDETVNFQLEFADGAVMSATTSYNFKADRHFVAYANNQSTLEIRDAFNYSGQQLFMNGRRVALSRVVMQSLQMDAVCRSLESGADTGISGAEGLKDMCILDAIYRSIAADGRRVVIDYS